jgi:hypothetical protein
MIELTNVSVLIPGVSSGWSGGRWAIGEQSAESRSSGVRQTSAGGTSYPAHIALQINNTNNY